jgi:hypothetical protein
MSKNILDAKCFHDEYAAYAWVEARVWPEGPVCHPSGGYCVRTRPGALRLWHICGGVWYSIHIIVLHYGYSST